MLAGGLRPLPGRLVTDSRSALGARRARPHATPFAQQHLKFHGPPNSGRSVAEWAPSLKKATGASRPSLQQRLPGAEGPPEGRSTAPRHAACGGPIPSSRGPVLILFLREPSLLIAIGTRREGLGSARLLIAVSTTFLLIFCYLAPQLLQNFCESFLSICSTMSGKGRLVRKFRHFLAFA